MLVEVKAIIKDSCTLEQAALLESAEKLLRNYGVISHEAELNNIAMQFNELPTDSIIQGFWTIYESQIDYLLGLHEIELVDGVGFSVKIDILDSLLLIQSWEEVSVIEDIVMSDIDDIAKLSSLLSLVSLKPELHFEEAIASVNPKVFKLLIGLLSVSVLEEIDKRDIETVKKRIGLYIEKTNNEFIQTLLSDNVPVGLDKDIYLNKLSMEDRVNLGNEPEKAGVILLGLVLLSDVKNTNVIVTLTEIFDEIFDTLQMKNKAMSIVTSLCPGIGVS